MRNFIFKLGLIALVLTPFCYFGQETNPAVLSNPTGNQEKCGFDAIHRELMLNDAIYRQKTLDFERDLPFMVFDKVSATYVIPVVVHVMETGTSISAITDEQIRDAIKNLNERLRKTPGGLGDGNGVDIGVEYALAVRNPSGNCTNGIVRVDMTGNATYMASGVQRSSGSGITDAALKALSVWDQTKYYNMWLISEIDNNNGGAGTQGYAYFASSHGTSVDGSVMVINSFKDPTSTTLIHELGHSLNLYHTFEGDRDLNSNGYYESCPSNTAGTACGSGVGDCCSDIPAHSRSMDITDANPSSSDLYYDCTNNTNIQCGTGTHQDHIHNYLDYSSDDCQNMLTANQRTRMQAAITGTRASFLTSNALTPVSAATVAFEASKTILCGTGNTVTFTDLSSCIPNTYMGETSWSGITFAWTITNGTNTYTSTAQNPTITFSNSGTFDVTLAVTNAFGTSTYTESGMIVVSTAPTTACTPTFTNIGNYNQTVNKVTFNTINNSTSTLTNGGYSDLTCSANTIVEPGSTYNLAIDLKAGGSGTEYVEVWIDYDNDGTIDAGETVLTGNTGGTNTTTTISQNITIPGTATQNTLLRMRVMGETFGAPSTSKKNCTASYSIGDVEDYGIYIKPACGVVSGTTPGSVCTSGTVTLGATGNGTLNWYAASTGGASLGTGTSFTTPSISSTTTYYVDATFSGCTSPTRTAVIATVNSTPSTPTLSSPTNTSTGISTSASYSWTAVAGATSYDIQIATDAGFTAIVTSANIATNSYNQTPALNTNTTYFWRVRANNACGNGSYTAAFSFTTSNVSCNTYASTDVPVTIVDLGSSTSTITIASGVTITDVNVLNLVGTHTYINDLTIKLQSPNNTIVTLFSGICASEDDFNLNFDDAAAAGALPCPATDGGTYQASTSLSAFNGENSAGVWSLVIDDGGAGDIGDLTSWSLEICGSACSAPTITSQPSASTICAGANTSFTTAATGATGFQWQVDAGSGFGNITNGGVYSGATTATLTITGATIGMNAYQYRCVTSSACSNTNTNAVLLTVNSNVTPSISISSNDADNSICTGTSVTFTATPTNGGGAPSYQWKLNGGNVGTNSTTYNNGTIANGDIITCVLTSNATCASPTTATSTGITMTVNSAVTPSVSITSNDADNTICAGTSVTFTATPTNGGASPSYQWKLNGANVGINSSTYSNSALANGNIITCVMTSSDACASPTTGTSSGITITVNSTVTPSVVIASNDADNTICTGTSITFTATPTNGGASPSYQWKLNGGNVGTNSTTYSNSALVNGDIVTCVMTSNATCASPATATSSGITTTVNSNVTPSVSIASNDADNTICAGTAVTFTATPTNGGATPSYQWKLNGGNVGTNSSNYTTSSLTNGDVVTCELTSNATCLTASTATSSGIAMTVGTNLTPNLTITSSDADNTICPNNSVTFTATPTNGGSSPTYQWKLNGSDVGTNSTIFTTSSLANGDVVLCEMTSNATCLTTALAQSNSITTTVFSSVTPSISIGSDDADNIICASTSVLFTATPTFGGSSPSYQWKLNGSNVGTNSSTYSNGALSNNDIVTCVLTSNEVCTTSSTANSNSITMTVNSVVTPTISISSDDTDNTICTGTNITFTASPTNGGSSPTYDWKLNGTSVATGLTYSNSSLLDNDVVSCVLTSNDACASPLTATSNSITISIVTSLTPAVTIISDDADNTTCSGTTIVFTASPTNGGSAPTYDWKVNGTSVASGASFSTNTLIDADVVSCIMTSNDACASPLTATSNGITITIATTLTPAVTIASDDVDNTICSGVSVLFTATPTNGGTSPTYDWKVNGTSVATGATYSNNALINNDVISCIMTSNDACASPLTATSNSITMTVSNTVTPSISIASDDTDNIICSGTSVTFTATPTNGGASPTYVWKINGSNVATGATFNNNSLANNDVVSCVLTSNDACASPLTATSNNITMTVSSTVSPSVAITSDDADNAICTGTTVIFTATPTNGGAAPTYDWKLNGTSVATGVTYTNSSLANSDIVSCVMTSNDACASPATATSNSISMTVSGSLTPSVIIASDDADNAICTGTSVTFTATPTNGGTAPTYDWKVNGTSVATGATYTNSSLINSDIVSCILTSNDACASPSTATSNSITMTVSGSLTPSVVVSSDDADNAICTGTTVIFTATPTNGGSAPTYDWKLNGTSVATGVTYTNTSLANSDIVSCVMTSNDACASPATATSNSITMTVSGSLTPSVIIASDDADNAICTGTNVTFTATPSNGGSSPTYDWKVNGTSVATGATYTNNSLVNSDVVSCVLTSNDACASPLTATSNSITMTVSGSLTPSVIIASDDADNTICSGTSVTFTATPTNGGSAPTYDWKLNGNSVSSGVSYSNGSLNNGDIISCVMTSNYACPSSPTANSSSITMAVNAKPTVSSSSGLTFCQGQSITLTSSLSSNNSWSTGATTNSIVVSTSGTYTVTNTVGGCTSNNIVVTVNPTPTAAVISASGSTTICTGGNVVLSSDLSSGNVWSTGATSQSITVSSAGNYSVTTTLGSCTATSNVITVTTATSPTIALGSVSQTTSCSGSDGTIQINGSGSGTISWTGTTNGSQNVILPILLQNFAVGSYNLTFNNGCNSNTVSATITQPALPTAPTISAVGSTTFCQGSSVVLQSSLSSGNVWSTNETTQAITVSTAGTYSVTVTSAPNCTATSNSIVVTVNPTPSTPSITASGPTTFCQGGNVVLTSSSVSGNSWTGGSTAQSITVTSSGSYVVSVTQNGCTSPNSAPIVVTVNPIPAAPFISASGPVNFCQGQSVTLTSDITSGIVWSPGGETTASITVSTAGTFFVTNTLNGCSSNSASVTTSVSPAPTIAPISDICNNASPFTLTQGSPAGGIYQVNGVDATNFTPNDNNIGLITVSYSIPACSGSVSTTFNVLNCTGVGLDENSLSVKLFPNPTSGIIAITGIDKSEITSIKVYDQIGKLILIVENNNQVDLTNYANGMYNLVITGSTFESMQKVQLIK